MLFDMSASSNSRKIMQLNPEYPKDVTMKSTDGTAVFKAEIAKNGRPDEYTYQWYANGAAVAEANYKEYKRDISGDKGQYTVWCEVTNKAGTVRTRTATLTVNRLPVLDKNSPADASATIGNTCEFKATVSEEGYPAEYTYQWYLNGNAVEGATNSSFKYTKPSIGTDSIYCIVTNKAGSVQTRTATYTATAEYVFKNGQFYDGNGIDWSSNKEKAGCSVGDTILLYCTNEEQKNAYAAAWLTKPIDATGKNKLIFTVTKTTSTTSDENNVPPARLGVTNGANLGNTNMSAEVSFRMVIDYSIREYTVDVSGFNEPVYIKILIDKMNTNYNTEEIEVSAIRFE